MLFVIVIAVLVFALVSRYNRLQRYAHGVKRCNADIMAALQKKADLANRLMDIAKEAGMHEKVAHITLSNNMIESARALGNAAAAVTSIGNHPNLRANENYQTLMHQMQSIDEGIQMKREAYNNAVSVYNSYLVQIPQCFFATSLGFSEAPYFNLQNAESTNSFETGDTERLKEVFARATGKTVETVKKSMDAVANEVSSRADVGKEEEKELPQQ